LTYQDEIFVNNPLDIKKNDEHALDFCSSLIYPLDMPFKHQCTAYAFFPEPLSNHCQGLRRTVSEICKKIDAIPLSDPSRNSIRQDTQLQIKGRKKSARPFQLREILYTDSQDMLVVAWRYYNCCTDGNTSSENYGCTHVIIWL
jgi:hypothetical protein